MNMKKKNQIKENVVPNFFTFDEVLEKLRLNDRGTLMRLIRSGQIGYTKIGKQYRFSATQIEKFLEENTVTF